MQVNTETILIYHITDVANLPGILAEGGLHSDAAMAARHPEVVIGYDHIKLRRLRELTIPCCGDRTVGEFVPFYFCPRSPMLLAVNNGRSGRPAGCSAPSFTSSANCPSASAPAGPGRSAAATREPITRPSTTNSWPWRCLTGMRSTPPRGAGGPIKNRPSGWWPIFSLAGIPRDRLREYRHDAGGFPPFGWH